MYLFFALFITCLSLVLLVKNDGMDRLSSKIILAVMTILLVFRYGQGTDYFAYNYLFLVYRNKIDGDLHGEVGFQFLSTLIYDDYTFFIAIISLYQCYMIYLFLKRHCYNKIFTLYMLFPTVYLVYFFSGIRQGIVIATFLGLGLSMIKSEAWTRYVLMCFMLSLFHSVAVVLLIIPVCIKLSLSNKIMIKLMLISFGVGLCVDIDIEKKILLTIPYFGNHISPYLRADYSLSTILEKCVTLFMVLVLYYTSEYKKKTQTYISIYLWGHILYFTLLPFSTLSSRTIVCFKVLETMIVPNLLKKGGRYKPVVYLYFIVLTIFLYVYHVNGFLVQGDYFDDINCINYPYVSIFNKEDIWNYRILDEEWDFLDL